MRIDVFGVVVGAALVIAACSGDQKSAVESGANGAKSAVGGPCGGDGECQAGLACDKGDPGGQCQKACATNADCGAGAVCGGGEKSYHPCKGRAAGRKGATGHGSAQATSSA